MSGEMALSSLALGLLLVQSFKATSKHVGKHRNGPRDKIRSQCECRIAIRNRVKGFKDACSVVLKMKGRTKATGTGGNNGPELGDFGEEVDYLPRSIRQPHVERPRR
jgi:hypothetical protein